MPTPARATQIRRLRFAGQHGRYAPFRVFKIGFRNEKRSPSGGSLTAHATVELLNKETNVTVMRQSVPAGAVGNVMSFEIETEVHEATVAGMSLTVRTVVRNPMVGTTISEMRDIRPLSGAALDAQFEPDRDWIVVDGPQGVVRESEVRLPALER